ncbi:MAG: hypothetical protein J6X03_05940 [Bacilli bacterium]|nr:hypothetical protein [Bacilli bacterium]
MKKKNVLFALGATAVLLLSSCDRITAYPVNGDDPLTDTEIVLDHNTLKTIYDSIRTNNSYASDVRNLLAVSIAEKVLGKFEIQADTTNEFGFKVVLTDYDGKSDSDKKAFIDSHGAYKNWEHTAFKLTMEEGAPSKDQFETRLGQIKKLIEEKIVTTLWDEANTSTYKRNNRFYEILYARDIYKKLYRIVDNAGNDVPVDEVLYENPTYQKHYKYFNDDFDGFNNVDLEADDYKQHASEYLTNGFTDGVLIDKKFNTNSDYGLDMIKKVLHINYYTDYINHALLPTVIQNLLVEQYIIQEQYSAVGNTQSRQVNYISIPDNDAKNGTRFLKEFVNNYFTGSTAPDSAKLNLETTAKFDIASVAWKGIADDIEAAGQQQKDLAVSNFGAATTDNPSANLDGHAGLGYIQDYGDGRDLTYYKNTAYADLIDNYSTLTHDGNTNNSTNYSSFTSIDSITYDPIVGLEIKTDDIRVKSYQTEGWYTKDASPLPSDIKNKLYAYGLMNEWAPAQSTPNYQGWYLYKTNTTDNHYFLKKDNYSSAEDSIIWEDGGNYYVVEIIDVVTPDLVSIDEETSAAEKVTIEEKVRRSAYTLATGSTYTTNAITYYLQKCNINYHDQDVFDYFKTTYPKLFED